MPFFLVFFLACEYNRLLSVFAPSGLSVVNQNQSNYSGQSQQTQTIQRTNQISKQSHVAGAERGKTRAIEQVTIGFGFTSDWLRKWHKIF